MNEHPSALRLDAWHMGEADPGVETHVAGCADCRRYVSDLEAEKADFARTGSLDMGALLARAAAPEVAVTEKAAPKGKLLMGPWMWAVGGLLAAAAAFVMIRPDDPGPVVDQVRLKGGPGLALVVQRGEVQTRETTEEVRVRPGDRLRIEVRVAEAGLHLVGLLDADGSFTTVEEGEVQPGTRVLERTFAVDDRPTRLTVLAGPPAEVDKARLGRPADVSRLRIVSDPP